MGEYRLTIQDVENVKRVVRYNNIIAKILEKMYSLELEGKRYSGEYREQEQNLELTIETEKQVYEEMDIDADKAEAIIEYLTRSEWNEEKGEGAEETIITAEERMDRIGKILVNIGDLEEKEIMEMEGRYPNVIEFIREIDNGKVTRETIAKYQGIINKIKLDDAEKIAMVKLEIGKVKSYLLLDAQIAELQKNFLSILEGEINEPINTSIRKKLLETKYKVLFGETQESHYLAKGKVASAELIKDISDRRINIDGIINLGGDFILANCKGALRSVIEICRGEKDSRNMDLAEAKIKTIAFRAGAATLSDEKIGIISDEYREEPEGWEAANTTARGLISSAFKKIREDKQKLGYKEIVEEERTS